MIGGGMMVDVNWLSRINSASCVDFRDPVFMWFFAGRAAAGGGCVGIFGRGIIVDGNWCSIGVFFR